MELKAEPVGYKASDGIRYETEEKAIQASMEWEMMAVLMRFYRYDDQRVAKAHARQLFELEDKGVLEPHRGGLSLFGEVTFAKEKDRGRTNNTFEGKNAVVGSRGKNHPAPGEAG